MLTYSYVSIFFKNKTKMAVKTLLENHSIEEVVNKIIARFHTPLPDLIDNINKR
jgi:hypothetical protein